ncbi:3-hydroxyanthranilic acid dioxygenase [Basidiobolus meristosporus CBS 931.73]|uniref:3-hydroxyanthranilate 3,4-dioxygenase n=1 Tax=Basidiobolus meristosporus CBS 931.73 TaxID=1314790 RepID=A0A1Y1XVI9_9FUNG|nr:3-hydroxyanthranilic acid dioxygenase [Basidiobolus meristosporus CBS 931.73]|eukprot:ORX89768.1 3-hydroxyanthranilic acid dioxygenase [Basidiobolus meristosporus CBS 931.73]
MPSILPPINFRAWIEEHKDKLQPPVNNYLVHKGNFIVMAVGGPNKRTDFHINETEEWFYQYRGDMLLKVMREGKIEDITIHEGEFFILPANVPHNPIRFADTIGVVIESQRQPHQIDRLRWYCDNCLEVVYEEGFHCTDLGTQLKPVIEKYADDAELRRCKKCQFQNSAK